MCVVSMVSDFYQDKWSPRPWWPQNPTPYVFPPKAPSQEEFDILKKEVEDLKELLKKAKEYDKKNNEPDCEIDEKIAKLKAVAKLVGVDLDEVLAKNKGWDCGPQT